MEHVPFKHKRTTLDRAKNYISKEIFTDVNLRGRVYTSTVPLKNILHCTVPDRLPYSDVVGGNYKFEPCAVGDTFGPVWSTHWFLVNIDIPADWEGKEVHLIWNALCETLVYVDGHPVQGLSGDYERYSYPLNTNGRKPGSKITLYLEMACNELLGIGNIAMQKKEDEEKKYTLIQAEIGLFDREAYDLVYDVETLHDIAQELPDQDQRGYQALYTVNKMINMIDFEDRSTLKAARNLALEFFNQKNGESQHTLYAMGHAHMDTGWLWPYAETIRKCARSWSCSLRLMEKYPDYKLMCSQAQQLDWVKEKYPSLWEEILSFVKTGQFVPVGGTWVEMDGNIPSGEACVRQFLYGQNFFIKEFGIQCKEFWLPDTFGYSAQFPQILRHCDINRFVTQKMSWSIINKFPHHTFHWEGIDGSSVLAHFPPGDSYKMTGTVNQVRRSSTNFQDKGRSNRSLFLFGYGDGGNGPSEEMMERLLRMKDCDGLPKVHMSNSDEFFDAVEKEKPDMLCRWRGELYLELHNGTYTTWAQVKKYNRRCEVWLKDLEIVATLARQRNPSYQYPKAELDRMWKLLLLNQFHDVLPGTSITMVFEETMSHYRDIEKTTSALINEAARAGVQKQTTPAEGTPKETFLINTQPFPRREVIEFWHQANNNDEILPEVREHNVSADIACVEVEVPPLSIRSLSACEITRAQNGQAGTDNVSVKRQEVQPFGEVFVLDNGIIRACVDRSGRIVSLKRFDKAANRWTKEAVDPQQPMNQFVIYDDVPLYWDAWDIMDYHLETRKTISQTTSADSYSNKLKAVVKVGLKISDNSSIEQEIVLDADSPYLRVNLKTTWHMNRKCLKVEFPTTVHATEASYDIQSGFLRRPNHYNTSWDSARYEVCGHKWADLSEHGFGVSVMNDCKYGWAAVDGTLRMSLLRSPKNPDPEADMGLQTCAYAILPHFGSLQEAGTINYSLAFNNPLRSMLAPAPVAPEKGVSGSDWFEFNSNQVVLQAVKLAEDGSNTIILRVHEAFGGKCNVRITTPIQFKTVQACNGLEHSSAAEEKLVNAKWAWKEGRGSISFDLTPFQMVSLKCCL
ncbi:alpha-mannosidase 2C1 [Aplysia californica]|uniref:alpha-mannosidase n=1 Tax=Aplysia californica TaxID=6500 RepID=A0ABM0KAT2_APLCA|nr:alpha-mannosidase 2C1 [Aplysia californica]